MNPKWVTITRDPTDQILYLDPLRSAFHGMSPDGRIVGRYLVPMLIDHLGKQIRKHKAERATKYVESTRILTKLNWVRSYVDEAYREIGAALPSPLPPGIEEEA